MSAMSICIFNDSDRMKLCLVVIIVEHCMESIICLKDTLLFWLLKG